MSVGQTIEPPGRIGFRMPAEWSAHERCWMAWPCRRELWRGRIAAARRAYAAVARVIAAFEPVTMIARAEDAAEAAGLCGDGVTVDIAALDDSWMRDIGPTFLRDAGGRIAGVNWRFNAWGGKYGDCAHDGALAASLLDTLGIRRFDAPFVLEGGAIHSDGEGTVLTTESVLLNPNRGMAATRAEAEALLARWLGAEKVIWLSDGLVNDETDGHVDNVACFSGPARVLALSAPDRADPNHRRLAANLDILRQATDARGRRLDVVRLEQPTVPDETGEPGVASYMNFYIANGAIVMPAFAEKTDAAAAATLRAVFPGREIVQVDARDIVRGGGGIHCITQQQPRALCET